MSKKTKPIRVPLALYNFLNIIGNDNNEPIYDVIRRLLHFPINKQQKMSEKEFIEYAKVLPKDFDYKKYLALNNDNEVEFQKHSNHLTTHRLRENSTSMNSIYSCKTEDDFPSKYCSWFVEANSGLLICCIMDDKNDKHDTNKEYIILEENIDFWDFFE